MALVATTAHASSFSSPVTQAVTATAGSTLILGFSTYKGVVNSITDDAGNTYTKVADAGTGNARASLFYCRVDTGGSLTLTITKSAAQYCSGYIREYDDLIVSPLDKFVTNTGTGTAVNSGNTTITTQAAELVVGVMAGLQATYTITAGSGFGNLVQAAMTSGTGRVAMEDKTVAAIALYNAVFTCQFSEGWAAICATFKTGAPPAAGVEPGRRMLEAT
jgi:hypothetical protein